MMKNIRKVESLYGWYEYSASSDSAIYEGGYIHIFKGLFRTYSTPPIEMFIQPSDIINKGLECKLKDGETIAVKVFFLEHIQKKTVDRIREEINLKIDSENGIKTYAFLQKNGLYHEIMEFIDREDI